MDRRISVTPMMVSAGVSVVEEMSGSVDWDYLVKEIYIAMQSARQGFPENEIDLSAENSEVAKPK